VFLKKVAVFQLLRNLVREEYDTRDNIYRWRRIQDCKV
jgi:hypothetical protein